MTQASEPDSPPIARTLVNVLSQWPANRVAYIDAGQSISYGQWQTQAARLASLLRRCSIEHGDRVALWLPNGATFLNAWLACAQIGAIAIAVNTRFKTDELQDILSRTGASMLITDLQFDAVDFGSILSQCDFNQLTHLQWILNDLPRAGQTISVKDGPELPVKVQSIGQANDLPSSSIQSGNADSPCIIFTTSGTTSRPKFVLHSQRTLLEHATHSAAAFGLNTDSRLLLAPPLCGVFGLCHVTAALMAGCQFIMRPVWNATEAARDIDEYGVTHFNATDDAIIQLLAQSEQTPAFPTVRFAGYAAFNPALNQIVADADRRGLKLVGLYGTSEVQALIARQSEMASISDRSPAGGQLVDRQARVRTRDPATGDLQPHQVHGELEFFCPASRMLAYFGNPDASVQAMTQDGWYRSGDLGYTVSDTAFVFLERLGDAMRLGGFLTSPLEIEMAIQAHPSINACQVVLVNARAKPRAFAWVVAEPGHHCDEQAIMSFLTNRLARYKQPVAIATIDAFPVTEGTNAVKIQKSRLREMAQQRIDRLT